MKDRDSTAEEDAAATGVNPGVTSDSSKPPPPRAKALPISPDPQVRRLGHLAAKAEAKVVALESVLALGTTYERKLEADLVVMRTLARELEIISPEAKPAPGVSSQPTTRGAATELLSGLAQALQHVAGAAHVPSNDEADDAFITQDDKRLPDRELYLRLARKGEFPSTKHGKKVVARWGDVKLALVRKLDPRATTHVKAKPDDGLDAARRLLGFQEKAD